MLMTRRFFPTLVCCALLPFIGRAQHTGFTSATPDTAATLQARSAPDLTAARDLIHRILPARASAFIVEACPAAGNDTFEVESSGGHIILRGNNGVAVASALYFYLTEYAHCQITWNGDNLALPPKLPTFPGTIRRTSPWRYRYYLNYCTFNYSMSWWDWDRWQREIDWMALHGINMPLAITGEEYTWYKVYHDMGFSDADLAAFFCGPAYFAWFWMGNLDGWGGPLPMHWMEEQRDLQKKILDRERSLGMTPVLPAFTGHVPPSFPAKFPSAHCKVTNWHNGFNDTYLLDASDPLFAAIGKKFLAAQTALFGTDHLYSADTFNENEPPSDDPAYLAGLSGKIYAGMRQADPDATWVMQGWLFYSDRKFWKAPQIKALLDAVPNDHMLLLDLAAEIEPIWKRTNAFYGKPWIWNMINNFGGNVNLFGRMDAAATGPAGALDDTASGKLKGIGLTMEGIATNPVLYELMLQNTWQPAAPQASGSTGQASAGPNARQATPIDLHTWLPSYIRNRYGFTTPGLEKAWDILHHTVYNGKVIRDGAESIITGRPTLDSSTVWTRTQLNYAPGDLLPAWDLFVQAASQYHGPAATASHPAQPTATQPAGAAPAHPTEGFSFDLVDLTRQMLANYATVLQQRWVRSYRAHDTAAFRRQTADFLKLIDDLDTLLATQKDFLLGPWLADARRKGITPEEKALYERNARDLITLWGDAGSPLHEYANRQWSGLLKDFYKPRWEKFFAFLAANPSPDLAAFDATIRKWEWAWVNEQKAFPTTPKGDPITTVKYLYRKYRKTMSL
ncbi:MAG TPA: alpha-N-acetylglucosaminidase [Puia sp.]|nr:alpha-N-acetylglucosaminidase [Puia sp.]